MAGAANQATMSCNPKSIRRENMTFPRELQGRQSPRHAAAPVTQKTYQARRPAGSPGGQHPLFAPAAFTSWRRKTPLGSGLRCAVAEPISKYPTRNGHGSAEVREDFNTLY